MKRAWILLWLCWGSAAAIEEKQNIRESYSGVRELVIENVNGQVEVTGYDGAQVLVEAVRTGRAVSAEALAEARREVRLDVSWPAAGVLKLRVEGPSRNRDGERRRDPGYEVRYDISVQAPRETVTRLRTVNGGVVLRETTGRFDVSTVNGGVQAADVGAAGSAKTVNGTIRASFLRNPAEAMSFKTVNGAIELSLRAGLNAEVRAKTLNGGIHTTLPATRLALRGKDGGSEDRLPAHWRDRTQHLRFGAGGPEIACETVNGDVRVTEGK